MQRDSEGACVKLCVGTVCVALLGISLVGVYEV